MLPHPHLPPPKKNRLPPDSQQEEAAAPDGIMWQVVRRNRLKDGDSKKYMWALKPYGRWEGVGGGKEVEIEEQQEEKDEKEGGRG